MKLSEKITDKVVSFCGSWSYIHAQNLGIAVWVITNKYFISVDPYPWLLLNFLLSYLGAFTTPFILMAGNRQQELDRLTMAQNIEMNRDQSSTLQELHAIIVEMMLHMEGLVDVVQSEETGACSGINDAEPSGDETAG